MYQSGIFTINTTIIYLTQFVTLSCITIGSVALCADELLRQTLLIF
jgi:hypothetical protein